MRGGMEARRIDKPGEGEYAPYAIQYIGLLPDDGLILKHLRDNLRTTRALLSSLSDDQLTYRYAESKWTIKEIVLHLADDERIYAYRALRFARNDRTELPGFEQDDYARLSGANARSLEGLLEELATVRAATVSLYEGFDDEALLRGGIASGSFMTVRAIAYHIAGHELRHINVVRDRYLG